MSAQASSPQTEASAASRYPAEQSIDNLQTDYCSDFVCTSSPAVEQTVRSLARDLGRLQLNANFFQPDATYSDGFRSFKGSDKFRGGSSWARDALTNPSATVTKMAMLDNGRAQIDWTLSGGLGALSGLSIPVSSVFELNLVTGRVTALTEAWDLSKLPPPVAAALVGSRALWSAKAAGKDAGDALGTKVTETLSSIASLDDDDEYQMNPNDPTRFFQSQGGQQRQDAFMLATAVAALYLVFKVFESLETLH